MNAKIPPLSGEITDLLTIIRTLRGPEGCLWDRKQAKGDIGHYLIEEAWEVIDAVNGGKADHLKEELGDLLFQILFLTVLSEERDEFTLSDLITAVSEKMIRRHPHVFDDTAVKDVEEIKNNWAYIKEHVEKKPVRKEGYLGKYPLSMPALAKAQKISDRAARVGFDWETASGVLEKIDEEIKEMKEAVDGGEKECIEEEIGDLLFSIVNLCRFTGIDAEQSLRKTTNKFERRFGYIEKTLANRHETLLETSPEEMNRLWNEAKSKEKEGKTE
ncbi:MAG TPA: nucleoside triphosphate pyrophosphohydrolase [Syntrophales bacterium]|jgi:tetrapyrrole methylase family protein/MazG family protein|nr:nucleoside triphosphate pyrophosphohydrolase [Syntrophales bacterium]HPX55639.1 nucleoside triphosphate pyrophosphohydrolase [Syntrophales bacterium]HQA82097.1 nucleoside triphosphate pyrophosphohydrolase [Syntrophales bacterium]